MTRAYLILLRFSTALILAWPILLSSNLFAQTSNQLDSTVTVSPQGDTVVTYQIRKTDFGRDIICCYPDQRSLTEKEKAELHKQSREEQKSENLRKLNAIRERRRRQPIRSGTYAVGEIPLISGVTPSGGKTYQIPIPTAPGIRFAPSVSLVYNSQAGDGAAGYGWDISGIPSIRLINQNVYYHGKAKAADISTSAAPCPMPQQSASVRVM